jgi:hypothetical protein
MPDEPAGAEAPELSPRVGTRTVSPAMVLAVVCVGQFMVVLDGTIAPVTRRCPQLAAAT